MTYLLLIKLASHSLVYFSSIWFEGTKHFRMIWRLDIVQNLCDLFQFFLHDFISPKCFNTPRPTCFDKSRPKCVDTSRPKCVDLFSDWYIWQILEQFGTKNSAWRLNIVQNICEFSQYLFCFWSQNISIPSISKVMILD